MTTTPAELQITIGTGANAITFNDFTDPNNMYLLRNTSEMMGNLSTRQTKTPRQAAHGVDDSISFYNERILPFGGTIIATTQNNRRAKEKALKRLLALPTLQDPAGRDGYMLVRFTDEDGTPMQCYAKIVEDVGFDLMETTEDTMRGYQFVMMASDHMLPSQSLSEETGDETTPGTNFQVVQDESPNVPFELYDTTAASVTITNNGTIGALPVVVITGPAENPGIENQTWGFRLTLEGVTLAVDEYVTIDFDTQNILQDDGTDLSGFLSNDSEWWAVEPGDNEIALLDDSVEPTSTFTISWRDTYH